jgi:hypothetical protein
MASFQSLLIGRQAYPPPLETVLQYEKAAFSEKGERRSGGKDLERQPLTVLIQGRQPYDNIRYHTNDRFPYLKDPHSKSLEPDCLSPRSFNCDTVSCGGRVGEGEKQREWKRE